jgi:hypothetical protein
MIPFSQASDMNDENQIEEKFISVEGTLEIWKAIAEKLWQILDEIDQAGDMLRPIRNNFFKYAISKSEERHFYLKSDGSALTLTQECIDNIEKERRLHG